MRPQNQMTIRIPAWTAKVGAISLAGLLVVTGVYTLRTSVELREAQSEMRSLETLVEAWKEGFLGRPTAFHPSLSHLPPPFVKGVEWYSETANSDIVWGAAHTGVYMVVDWENPSSQNAVDVALEVAENVGREVFLLDPLPGNGPLWREKYTIGESGLRVVTPENGWWSMGIPTGVTPVWFVVENGKFAGINVGMGEFGESLFDTSGNAVFSYPSVNIAIPYPSE